MLNLKPNLISLNDHYLSWTTGVSVVLAVMEACELRQVREFVLTPGLQPDHQGAEHTRHPALQAGYQEALLSDCKFQVIITM